MDQGWIIVQEKEGKGKEEEVWTFFFWRINKSKKLAICCKPKGLEPAKPRIVVLMTS